VRAVLQSDGQGWPAITTNLSETGVCLQSGLLTSSGRPVGGMLYLPTGEVVAFESEVRWIKKARGERTLIDETSVGLRFTKPPGEVYLAFLTGTRKAEGPWLATPPRAIPAVRTDGVELVAVAGRNHAGRNTQPRVCSTFAWPERLRPGLKGLVVAVARSGDFEGGALALQRGAVWIEQAAARAIAGLLPGGVVASGVRLEIDLADAVACAPGAKVLTTAQLADVTPETRRLRFDASIRQGGEEVASGQLVWSLRDAELS
jgi:hypothetical protein